MGQRQVTLVSDSDGVGLRPALVNETGLEIVARGNHSRYIELVVHCRAVVANPARVDGVVTRFSGHWLKLHREKSVGIGLCHDGASHVHDRNSHLHFNVGGWRVLPVEYGAVDGNSTAHREYVLIDNSVESEQVGHATNQAHGLGQVTANDNKVCVVFEFRHCRIEADNQNTA